MRRGSLRWRIWLLVAMLAALVLPSAQRTSSSEKGTKLFPAVGKAAELTQGATVAVTVQVVPDPEMPTNFALWQNHPNPFSGFTTVRFACPRSTYVTMKVYNAASQVVATLVDGVVDAGFHLVDWSGRDEQGHVSASGVYFCRMVAGTYVSTRKMVLIQ